MKREWSKPLLLTTFLRLNPYANSSSRPTLIQASHRRVKCDEVEPGCQRCVKARLTCPGYSPPQAWLFDPSAQNGVRASDPDSRSPLLSRSGTPLPMNREVNSGIVYQTAILDCFLMTWLPRNLVRQYTSNVETNGATVPMYGWPLMTWRLADRDHDGFVTHALLCLHLCVIRTQTNDPRLLVEAARQYARVLVQFQAQVRILAQSGRYSDKQDGQIASLAAAGVCCSQLEYILESWANGDQHLKAMASLLESCGSAALLHEDTRNIFCDHYILWTSLNIIYRRSSIYSRPQWINYQWFGHSPFNKALATAARISHLLEEHKEVRHNNMAGNPDLLRKFADVIVHIEAICPSPPTNPPEASKKTYSSGVMQGYCSALLIHAGVAMRELICSQECDPDYQVLGIRDINAGQDGVPVDLGQHVGYVCQSIDELANQSFGMVSLSLMLFFLDTAWTGYQALQDFCGDNVDDVRPWFGRIGDYVRGSGYQPLREPWLKRESISGPCGDVEAASTRGARIFQWYRGS